MNRKQVREILKRMVALTILKVTGILAGGAILGVKPVVSGGMAAIVAILQVSRDLAKAYVIDGELDDQEINESFKKIAEVPVAGEQVADAIVAGPSDEETEPVAEAPEDELSEEFADDEVHGH